VKMSHTIAITSRLFTLHPPATDFLRANDCAIVERIADSLPEDELIDLLRDADGLIAGLPKITDRVLTNAPRLKVICRTGVGYDTVDVEACTRHGVVVAITPGINQDAVADTTMTLLLALARNLIPSHLGVQAGQWTRVVGVEAWRKTLGIIGFGRVGQGVAQRARGFEMEVLVSDVVENTEAAARLGARFVPLEELLAKSDFVSLNAPLTPETHHIINADTLRLMKPTAYLINTARGGLIDEIALAKALREKQIAGAGLDVLSVEPPPTDHPLIGLDNVVLMPHAAGWSWESIARTSQLAAQTMLDVCQGRKPVGVVNEEVYQAGHLKPL